MQLRWIITALLWTTSISQVTAHEHGEWQNLLDEDLSQWEVYLGVPHKSVSIPGREPSPSEDGTTGEPLGLGNDPLDIFTVKMISGEPILQITGEIYGGLTSRDEFESYHLQLQFRWGDKKWPPRENKLRDSGVLIHCVGRHGAFWNVWMRSLECQIQEGDCGDFIPLAGSRATMPVRPDTLDKRPVYDPDGVMKTNSGYTDHGPSQEMPHGEWNTVDIYAVGEQAVFAINGTPNMALFDTRQNSADGEIPLTRGKLQIQSEGAEIEYRRVRLRTIDGFPAELSKYTRRPDEE